MDVLNSNCLIKSALLLTAFELYVFFRLEISHQQISQLIFPRKGDLEAFTIGRIIDVFDPLWLSFPVDSHDNVVEYIPELLHLKKRSLSVEATP